MGGNGFAVNIGSENVNSIKTELRALVKVSTPKQFKSNDPTPNQKNRKRGRRGRR